MILWIDRIIKFEKKKTPNMLTLKEYSEAQKRKKDQIFCPQFLTWQFDGKIKVGVQFSWFLQVFRFPYASLPFHPLQ